MVEATLGRRARLRAETTAEIKAVALRQMALEGPDAISLRAIARDMGMTAGAIYSYFETRDALVTALIADVYTSVADAMEAAQDAAPPDPASRLLAHGRAYRDWAVANPEEFKLIYGDPVPGYQPPDGGAASEAELHACAVLAGLIAAAWPRASALQSAGGHRWSDFSPGFAAMIRELHPELPPAAVALSLRVWGRMHGMVSLEVYGHLHGQVENTVKLFEADLHDLVRSLGLTPHQ